MREIICNPPNLDITIDPEGDWKRPIVTNVEHVFYARLTDGDNFNGHDSIEVRVPKNYRTDLTSRLNWLGWALLLAWPFSYFWIGVLHAIVGVAIAVLILRDPYGNCQYASLIHDRAYDLGWPKYVCDSFYLWVLEFKRVQWWRRYAYYYGVVIGGARAYWRHRSSDEETTR